MPPPCFCRQAVKAGTSPRGGILRFTFSPAACHLTAAVRTAARRDGYAARCMWIRQKTTSHFTSQKATNVTIYVTFYIPKAINVTFYVTFYTPKAINVTFYVTFYTPKAINVTIYVTFYTPKAINVTIYVTFYTEAPPSTINLHVNCIYPYKSQTARTSNK